MANILQPLILSQNKKSVVWSWWWHSGKSDKLNSIDIYFLYCLAIWVMGWRRYGGHVKGWKASVWSSEICNKSSRKNTCPYFRCSRCCCPEHISRKIKYIVRIWVENKTHVAKITSLRRESSIASRIKSSVLRTFIPVTET